MEKKYIATFLVLFAASFVIGYLVTVRRNVSGTTTANSSGTNTQTEEPKTEECPLNGEMYGKSNRTAWEKRRPLGVMVENSTEARPQSGLSSANVVFEAVAEGGITRFLSVFYCQDAKMVGPVRSARVYFLDFIGGFGSYPLYAHVGGANTPGPADALGQIEKMDWAGYNDLNQFSVGFPVFWRDYDRLPGVAVEHTMYSSTELLWKKGAQRGLASADKEGAAWDEGFTPWVFKDDPVLEKRPKEQSVAFGFWDKSPAFNVLWTYDPQTNVYMRENGGEKHMDKDMGKQLATKNIVILFMDESDAQDGYDKGQHLLYDTLGSGKAMLIHDGKATSATWKKKDRFSQIRLYDESGQELEFTRGKIWFELLPTGNQVKIV
ncbi:MAG: DUF3048 domain-containing protein [Candidatus Roizmanbacteria bacterium]|nr:DUF3048 domain-containing protein [Candidatus Roizmanbacteria bacterium]